MQAENLNKEIHCRLCLKIISRRNSEITEEVAREVLEVVLPRLNLEDKHLLCKVCCSKLFAAFNFISTCLGTEDIISSCVDSGEKSLVDLKEVYLKVNGDNQLTDICENQRICRLCIQLVSNDFKSLNEVDNDILNTYIPLVSISATKDPVICASCFYSIRTHGGFLKSCLEVQEKYKSVDKQSYINTEEIKVEPEDDIDAQEGDQDNDLSSYNVDEKIAENKGTCISDIGKLQFEYMLKCETDVQINKHKTALDLLSSRSIYKRKFEDARQKIVPKLKYSSECQMYMCDEEDYETNKRNLESLQLLKENGMQIQIYKCDTCTYETKYKRYLTKHQLKHKDPSEIQMHKCNVCNFETRYRGYLKTHELIHKSPSEIQMYTCDICTYETKYKTCLRDHQLSHKNPSEIKMYKCDTCNYETKHKGNLKSHQLLHKDPSEIQMYKCDICPYEAKSKKFLKYHELSHKDPSEVKMYECDTCDYKTKIKSNLNTHQLIHKDPSEIQIYKCDVCDYETKRKGDLKNHQLTHRDSSETQMHRCDICGYATKLKKHIKAHQLIHKNSSEIQMYKCDVCRFKTKRKSNLNRHQLVHKDPFQVQMYKCYSCTYETKYKHHMRNHQSTHKDLL